MYEPSRTGRWLTLIAWIGVSLAGTFCFAQGAKERAVRARATRPSARLRPSSMKTGLGFVEPDFAYFAWPDHQSAWSVAGSRFAYVTAGYGYGPAIADSNQCRLKACSASFSSFRVSFFNAAIIRCLMR